MSRWRNSPLLTRTVSRIALAGTILLVFYLTFIGGFVLGIREYKWRILTLVILFLLFGSWLVYKVLRRSNLPNTGLEYPLLIMLGASVLATIFSTDPRLSAGQTMLNIILAISFYFTLDWISNQWRRELLVNALLLCGAFVCVIGFIEYWQWYGGNWLLVSWREAGTDWTLDTSLRIKSIFHNPNYLAYYLVLLIGLSFYRLFNVTKLYQRWFWSGYLLMVMIVVFLTQSRGGLLGTLATMITIISLFLGSRLDFQVLTNVLKKPQWIFSLLILFIFIIFLGFPIIARTNFDNINTVSLRTEIWQQSLVIFATYPILGAGPATFPSQYIAHWNSAGYAAIFTHAHNVWLTIAAEYGIVGVISVGYFFVALTIMILKYFRHNKRREWSIMLLVGISILVGQGIHNLVDDFMEFPIFSWFTILAVTFCILPIRVSSLSTVTSKRPVRLFMVGAGLMLVMGSSLWYGRAFAAYDQARTASQDNDWIQAVHWLEKAVTIDPAYHFYRQQLALAYGQLVRIDDKYLPLALTQQEQLYQQGHNYPPDIAYLACLNWQLNRSERAIELMRLAINSIPSNNTSFYSYHLAEETFYFNLGYYLETTGQADLAIQSYQQVLDKRPQLTTSTFWQGTENRRKIIQNFSALTESTDKEYEIISTLLAQGDFARAENAIKKAIVLSSPWSEHTPRYYYLWGKLAELQGGKLLAKRNYELAIAMSTTIRTDYANLVGHRQPLVTEQPFCIMVPYPAEYLSKPSLALARLKLIDNDSAGAVEVYQNLLRYEPHNLEAQQMLDEILKNIQH